jgi:hypothetical protein
MKRMPSYVAMLMAAASMANLRFGGGSSGYKSLDQLSEEIRAKVAADNARKAEAERTRVEPVK